MEAYLTTTCINFGECRGNCGDSIRQAPTGRWFITIGHPGFNNPTNNTTGYSTQAKAVKALAYRNVKRLVA